MPHDKGWRQMAVLYSTDKKITFDDFSKMKDKVTFQHQLLRQLTGESCNLSNLQTWNEEVILFSTITGQ